MFDEEISSWSTGRIYFVGINSCSAREDDDSLLGECLKSKRNIVNRASYNIASLAIFCLVNFISFHCFIDIKLKINFEVSCVFCNLKSIAKVVHNQLSYEKIQLI